MDAQIDKLRGIMAKYGDAEKPIWITELGWPTHTPNVGGAGMLSAALKVARPEKKTWNVVYAACVADDAEPPAPIAEAILAALPSGSTAVACTPRETCRRLANGGVELKRRDQDKSQMKIVPPAEAADAIAEALG